MFVPTKTNNMYLDKTTNFNGNEFNGYTFIFGDDTEVTIDASGEIVDYSGMGYESAKKLINKLA